MQPTQNIHWKVLCWSVQEDKTYPEFPSHTENYQYTFHLRESLAPGHSTSLLSQKHKPELQLSLHSCQTSKEKLSMKLQKCSQNKTIKLKWAWKNCRAPHSWAPNHIISKLSWKNLHHLCQYYFSQGEKNHYSCYYFCLLSGLDYYHIYRATSKSDWWV